MEDGAIQPWTTQQGSGPELCGVPAALLQNEDVGMHASFI